MLLARSPAVLTIVGCPGSVTRHDAAAGVAGGGDAVLEPEVALARGRVLPEDVRLAVAVEIRSRGDRPLQRDVAEAGVANLGSAVHEPEVALARDGVLPENIGAAVAVEVGGRGDGPFDRHEAQTDFGFSGRAVHQADPAFTGFRILQQ